MSSTQPIKPDHGRVPGSMVSRRQFHAMLGAGVVAAAMPHRVFAQAATARPFRVDVPQKKLDDIKTLVRLARLPRVTGQDGWESGMDVAWLGRLQRYWSDRYDWRTAESTFNRYPQFMADVAGEQVHFLHVKGRGPAPKPLLLIHGWPYSNLSFVPFIDRLTDPARFGGDPASAMTVVVPAIPGYGFSSKPATMFGPKRTADAFHALMSQTLGYARYGVQGGDLGAVIGNYIAYQQPGAISGLHSNMLLTKPEPASRLTPLEKRWQKQVDTFLAAQMDYLRMQSNKPMMPGAALAASPMATAAWIAEKYWAWSDHTAAPDGDLSKLYSPDQLLTEIMMYVATDSIETSFWHYRAMRDEINFAWVPGRIRTPTADARFAFDYPQGRPPRSVADRNYNIVRFTDFSRGGHFPHHEQAQAFASDISSFFAGLAA